MLPELPMDPRNPRFGVRFVGYPALGLVVLSLPVAMVSRTSALALIIMSLGYVCVGIGLALTIIFTERVMQP